MIATLKKLITHRRSRSLPATDVVLSTAGQELRVALAHANGAARVTLEGALTRATAEMMAPWFTPLRSSVMAIDVDVERLMRLDRDALPVIFKIARGCALADVRFRVQSPSGRWRERLTVLEPSGVLRTGSDRHAPSDATSPSARSTAVI